MANSEPTWPKPIICPRPGSAQMLGEYNESFRRGFNQSLMESRQAFADWQRRENDDPASDPIGTVRQKPRDDQAVYYKSSDPDDPWKMAYTGLTGYIAESDSRVKGWPIIGFIPGTAAAEAAKP